MRLDGRVPAVSFASRGGVEEPYPYAPAMPQSSGDGSGSYGGSWPLVLKPTQAANGWQQPHSPLRHAASRTSQTLTSAFAKAPASRECSFVLLSMCVSLDV